MGSREACSGAAAQGDGCRFSVLHSGWCVYMRQQAPSVFDLQRFYDL